MKGIRDLKTGEAFVKALLKRGRYSFTLREVGETLGKRGPALNLVLQRLKKAGWIAPVSRGFYVALDVQHQTAGMLNPAWFVDDWAMYMHMAYYVGGLSAAELHGAAHQRPMQFQVFGNRQLRDVKQPSLHLATFYKRNLAATPTVKLKSPAGFFLASTPEATAGDIVAYHRCCPSLDHAATVLVELAEAIDARRLAALPEKGFSLPPLQRLGWLLDHVQWPEKAVRLHAALSRTALNWVTLESRLPPDGRRNDRWRVIENTDIQPDIER
jgi:predicted transcriptional regulator of viral defense system